MLGKLLKHEFRASFKKLGALWIAGFAMLALNAVILGLYRIPDPEESGAFATAASAMLIILPIMITVFTCLAVSIMTFVFIVTRFYKGLLRDEGYLMFTLPVTTGQLVASKGIVALVVQLISAVVSVAPFAILGFFYPDEAAMIFTDIAYLFSELNVNGVVYGVCYVLLIIVGSMEAIFRLYLAMSLGHLAKKHRVLVSIAVYVGFYYAYSIVTSCTQVACMCNATTMDLSSEIAMGRYTNGSMIFHVALALVLLIVEFFSVRHILSKKLNLE